ncbi:MAG: ADP-forming succinate--CoA ligase subunit beta [Bacillota bacterium]|nr:MAG: ADP-forming succinate--CoA ligase subunit beta [Planctomycetota bacterium]RUA09479.1 MAG: ADP-forming succinate--CoA ligase subunit beta [Bacillota bacterium]
MKIHEYQAKQLLKQHQIPVPRGVVAVNVEQALAGAQELGDGPWVVKAQIHAGGRGKGGGVRVTRTMEECRQAIEAILGMQLVTHQTGPGGQQVGTILIEEGCDIAREIYCGMVIDRAREKPVLMASAEGGMDIEEVAATRPDAIFFEEIDLENGLSEQAARSVAARLDLEGKTIDQFVDVVCKLARVFVEEDCSLAEINPMVVTTSGDVIALDAKINFDDNAEFRHPDHAELRDLAEEDPRETRASEWDLSYVGMDGTIGCMVNGAGLAMATMDIIKLHGGEPANFLDVGGTATADRVTEAFKIILEDPDVAAILVNIFGGIIRCDLIAEGIVQAARETQLQVPLIVRLEGNSVAEGHALLESSGIHVISADDLADAARKAVAAAEGGRG